MLSQHWLGTGGRVLTTGVSGPVSPSLGFRYQAKGRNWSPIFRSIEQKPVLPWCLHFFRQSAATGSLSCLWGDGLPIL